MLSTGNIVCQGVDNSLSVMAKQEIYSYRS